MQSWFQNLIKYVHLIGILVHQYLFLEPFGQVQENLMLNRNCLFILNRVYMDTHIHTRLAGLIPL